ncbi:MAG: hypothetical protein KKB37_08425 [Alphaproteobacteria bacterium]|nr:hypothetical protein [Alphaproteobacteria bacterium]
MILRILTGSVVALSLGFYAEAARAGQTFICGDGRLLQVELADIEQLKRTDACVAAHYGLSVMPVPLPVKRPKRTVQLDALKGTKGAAPPPPATDRVADMSVDYRRVRIINARQGQDAWFVHTR